eukprot:ctg_4748.g640
MVGGVEACTEAHREVAAILALRQRGGRVDFIPLDGQRPSVGGVDAQPVAHRHLAVLVRGRAVGSTTASAAAAGGGPPPSVWDDGAVGAAGDLP